MSGLPVFETEEKLSFEQYENISVTSKTNRIKLLQLIYFVKYSKTAQLMCNLVT